MDGTGRSKRIGSLIAGLVVWSGLMVMPISFNSSDSPEQVWSVGDVARAAGVGGSEGRGKNGGHTDHDHSDTTHVESDHDHDDSSHGDGSTGGAKGERSADRGHRGRAIGGGSRMVERWIFEEN